MAEASKDTISVVAVRTIPTIITPPETKLRAFAKAAKSAMKIFGKKSAEVKTKPVKKEGSWLKSAATKFKTAFVNKLKSVIKWW